MSQENETALLPRDIRNLEKLLQYAGKEKRDVEKLFTNFNNTGIFGLMWDSKVPEEDKWFFHFFTLKCSDRRYILQEIEKYIKLYEEIVDQIHKLRYPAELSDAERESPLGITNELFDKLKEYLDAAIRKKRATSSSVIYHLHAAFINQREKLESLITVAEKAALRKATCDAVTKAKQTGERINDLQLELNVSEERYDALSRRFQASIERHEKLFNKFVELEAQHEDLLRNKDNEIKALLQREKELEQKKKDLQEELANLQRTTEEQKNLQLQVVEMERKNMGEYEKNLKSNEALGKSVQMTAEVLCFDNAESGVIRESANMCLN